MYVNMSDRAKWAGDIRLQTYLSILVICCYVSEFLQYECGSFILIFMGVHYDMHFDVSW